MSLSSQPWKQTCFFRAFSGLILEDITRGSETSCRPPSQWTPVCLGRAGSERRLHFSWSASCLSTAEPNGMNLSFTHETDQITIISSSRELMSSRFNAGWYSPWSNTFFFKILPHKCLTIWKNVFWSGDQTGGGQLYGPERWRCSSSGQRI